MLTLKKALSSSTYTNSVVKLIFIEMKVSTIASTKICLFSSILIVFFQLSLIFYFCLIFHTPAVGVSPPGGPPHRTTALDCKDSGQGSSITKSKNQNLFSFPFCTFMFTDALSASLYILIFCVINLPKKRQNM